MKKRNKNLAFSANKLRLDVLEMAYKAGSGHLGGSFSCAEILTCLYRSFLQVKPEQPDWPERDRFILSKGHAAPILYAMLSTLGFFSKDDLMTLRKFGSHLQGHPDMRKTPGIDLSSGSLGMGLSTGIGMAWTARQIKQNWRVFVLAGDGELDEGQNWEAAMLAAKLNLPNLILIVDCNGVQLDGTTDDIMPLGNLEEKFQAFGWRSEIVDGHDCAALSSGIEVGLEHNGPFVLLARTVKGKGVAFMEGNHEWHGKALSEEEYLIAKRMLEQIC